MMVTLKQYDQELLLCIDDSFIVFNTVTSEEKIVETSNTSAEVSRKHHIQENENRSISSACYSKTGEFIAISAGKQVIVYRRDLSVVKQFNLQRSASKIRFTEDNDILVADKTGDAYLCKFEDEQNKPFLLLGHLSMLLDILLTHDKFIITCDRDEKIRVSCYPNAYNITSYCLGHREFVTNIEVIDQYLVSASGDGTIRFWDYSIGMQICSINTNDYIKDKDLIDSFCKEMDEEKCDVSSLPVVDMQVFRTELYIYIAVSLHSYKNIQIYLVQSGDKNVKCTFHSNITLDSVPICYTFNKNLYVLTKENIILYCLEDEKFELKENSHLVKFYNKYKEQLMQSENICISVLYKRKFDNVQEYLKRKKQRLEGKINS